MSLFAKIFEKRSSYVIGSVHDPDLGEAIVVYNPARSLAAAFVPVIHSVMQAHQLECLCFPAFDHRALQMPCEKKGRPQCRGTEGRPACQA
jgi:hypothetical protein